MELRSIALAFAGLACAPLAPSAPGGPADAPGSRVPEAHAAAGEPGGPGLALLAAKALTAAYEGEQVVDHAVLLVKDGRIEALGPADSTPVPAGYEVRDLGERWVMPGMIDLHSHVGGTFDINDVVYVTNPELKVHASVVPHNPNLKRALASGVTTVLYIPGSGSNMGGQGVLMKTGLDRYEEALVRDPGSLKVAQWGNPESWTVGVGKAFENWSLRDQFRRGLAYAKAWRAFEAGQGEKPEKDARLEVFRELLAKRTQVSTHTQVFQVVLMTITMIRREFGLDVYIDHGEMGGYKAGKLAQELGVPAIVGPRAIDAPVRYMINWTGTNPERVEGLAAAYQAAGVTDIGFNTDAPVIPAEELFLQAAMGVRYGLDNSRLETVRGLTIVPARTAGIADRVGSLEPGKEADVLVISGDPADPRTSVEAVFIEGREVYDTAVEPRRF